MPNQNLSQVALNGLRSMQQEEADSHAIYLRVARSVKDANRAVLERIAADELRHSRIWEGYTGRPCLPNRLRAWKYGLIARLMGFTFVVKLLENGEVTGFGCKFSRLTISLPISMSNPVSCPSLK